MKNVLVFVFTLLLGFAVNAQSEVKTTATTTNTTTTTKKPAVKKKTTVAKAHVCNASCKDGKHVYLHGEKGHVCGDDCKKMMMKSEKKTSSTSTKSTTTGTAHVCTAACKDGKHVYAHGEAGHKH